MTRCILAYVVVPMLALISAALYSYQRYGWDQLISVAMLTVGLAFVLLLIELHARREI